MKEKNNVNKEGAEVRKDEEGRQCETEERRRSE